MFPDTSPKPGLTSRGRIMRTMQPHRPPGLFSYFHVLIQTCKCLLAARQHLIQIFKYKQGQLYTCEDMQKKFYVRKRIYLLELLNIFFDLYMSLTQPAIQLLPQIQTANDTEFLKSEIIIQLSCIHGCIGCLSSMGNSLLGFSYHLIV